MAVEDARRGRRRTPGTQASLNLFPNTFRAAPSSGPAPVRWSITNAEVADVLDEVGTLLAAQETQSYRARAYHRAAAEVRVLPTAVATMLEEDGVAAVAKLPAVGPALARVVAELVQSGRLRLLDWLRGHVDPEALLASVPGIGPVLAQRLHDRLGVDTLEDLEMAAHDGRLARLPGFGRRRVQGVIEGVAGRLGPHTLRVPGGVEPPVAELLDVDHEYRCKVETGALPRITPRRFNPRRRAWLPILHTTRGQRHYTVLFSNTARAHRLGKTDDWVVIFLDDGHGHRQATVVTETRGPLGGHRVVRGREHECIALYQKAS
jgi:hypothetical protein